MLTPLVGAANTGGHFDILPPPTEGEFHPAALARHEDAYRRYRDNYAAQIELHDLAFARRPRRRLTLGADSARTSRASRQRTTEFVARESGPGAATEWPLDPRFGGMTNNVSSARRSPSRRRP